MLIYFHIDELARDSIVAAALKKELKKLGGYLVYGNRITTQFLLSKFNIFDAIILCSLDHYMLAFDDLESLPDNVFILQTEAVGQATGSLRRMNAKYFGLEPEKCEPWHKSVAGYLLWGHAHVNEFEDNFSYLEKARVVGHPRFSGTCHNTVTKNRSKKKVVGIVSRFSLLSPADARHPFLNVIASTKSPNTMLALYEDSPDRDVEDMFFTEVSDFRVLYEIVTSLNPDKFDVAIRPHPRENRHGWNEVTKRLDLNIKVSDWDEPFGHWLQNVDIVVTPPSTSIYDMCFNKLNPIVIDQIVERRREHTLTESDDNNQILFGVYRPKTIEEAMETIESGDIPCDREYVEKKLYEQVASDIARNSTINIIRTISEFTNVRPYSRKSIRVCSAYFFETLSFILAYARILKNIFSGRLEQGNSFDITLQRKRWINSLVE